MPRGGAHFSSQELAQVLSHYDIGIIHELKPLAAGSRRAPKMVIASDQGKYLLKRRPKGKDDLFRVAFSHSVQVHLAEKNFAVTRLIETRDEKNTILQIDEHTYELFVFVSGIRYNGSAEATKDTGRQLAKFHLYTADFAEQNLTNTLKTSYHDSSNVRRQLKTIGSRKKDGLKLAGGEEKSRVIDGLIILYNDSSIHVNELGFDSWDQQVIHGDWHPGNMLFNESKLAAVLDFDSVKIAPAITDLANGMLQFSLVGNRPNPADWPAYLDQAKLIQFLDGYREVIDLDKNKLDALLDMMIETIIAETVLPIAATGSFGHLSGFDFLKMIHRKAEWIHKNRKKLNQAIHGG